MGNDLVEKTFTIDVAQALQYENNESFGFAEVNENLIVSVDEIIEFRMNHRVVIQF